MKPGYPALQTNSLPTEISGKPFSIINNFYYFFIISVVNLLQLVNQYSGQSLRPVQLLATPWTAARQATLSITNSQRLLKFMSIESLMPSNHLILCCPPLLQPSIFPGIRVFSSESVLCIRWPNIGISASASVLPMNIQD